MVSIPDEKKVKDLISQLFTVNSRSGWILMRYRDPNTVVYDSHGTGPLPDLVNKLQDNEMAYMIFRISLDDQAQHVAAGAEIQVNKWRDFFVAWTGPKVGLIEKGKKKSHVGAVQALLSPVHTTLEAKNRNNFTVERCKYLSDPKAGSHIIE